LVPCWIFGEKDQYSRPIHGGLVDWLYGISKRYLGFMPVPGTPPFLMLPSKPPHGLHAVIGRPIRVPKSLEPSEEVVTEYLEKYIDALKMLWEGYKDAYDLEGEWEVVA
jgi:hypothetical protein